MFEPARPRQTARAGLGTTVTLCYSVPVILAPCAAPCRPDGVPQATLCYSVISSCQSRPDCAPQASRSTRNGGARCRPTVVVHWQPVRLTAAGVAAICRNCGRGPVRLRKEKARVVGVRPAPVPPCRRRFRFQSQRGPDPALPVAAESGYPGVTAKYNPPLPKFIVSTDLTSSPIFTSSPRIKIAKIFSF